MDLVTQAGHLKDAAEFGALLENLDIHDPDNTRKIIITSYDTLSLRILAVNRPRRSARRARQSGSNDDNRL
jgi:hypothetical protein